MATCPFCNTPYKVYTIVGVLPASEHLTYWLDPVPLAQLCCESCGRYTFMHPDHPEVQRLHKAQHFEDQKEPVRTLNIPLSEVGDPELREQFEHGCDGE
ncbi:MAG: hypothetical protein JOZ41_04420 [Chloroflexi bacterium]|nr:hypothetical protein [Chloroflexota bacterium]